jgi:anti-anti-sigma factor
VTRRPRRLRSRLTSLRRQLDDAVADGCLDFRIDVSRVVFVDASGLSVLVRRRNDMTSRGGVVRFEGASARFRWVAEVAGLVSAFGLDAESSGGGCRVQEGAARR